MSIVNSNAITVPFGKYEGMDLQELAQEHPDYARWMMKETQLRREYPDHYEDLRYYLQVANTYRNANKLFAPVPLHHH